MPGDSREPKEPARMATISLDKRSDTLPQKSLQSTTAGARLEARVALSLPHHGRDGRVDRLPLRLGDHPQSYNTRSSAARRRGSGCRTTLTCSLASNTAIFRRSVLVSVPLYGRRGLRQDRPRHVHGAAAEREVSRAHVHARDPLPPLGDADADHRADLALDLRRHAERPPQPHSHRLFPAGHADAVPRQPASRALVA